MNGYNSAFDRFQQGEKNALSPYACYQVFLRGKVTIEACCGLGDGLVRFGQLNLTGLVL